MKSARKSNPPTCDIESPLGKGAEQSKGLSEQLTLAPHKDLEITFPGQPVYRIQTKWTSFT